MLADQDSFIPLCVPLFEGNETRYLEDCVRSGFVSSVGSYVTRFEQEVARRVGAAHGVAVVNGTSALHLALRIAGVLLQDEVLVSSLTFIASANAIRYVGAWPIFVDSEPEYLQMDSVLVNRFLQDKCERRTEGLINRQTGRRVSAILPVHILGHPVNLSPLLALAREYKLAVIEDATECLGASYQGKNIGQHGDLVCFSFNGNKIMTTGGGGMITTNLGDWAQKARYLSTQARDHPTEYIHHEIGYNYRMNNLEAAMGCAQLERLDQMVAKKRQIADVYNKAFANVKGIQTMKEAPWAQSSFWMYTIRIHPEEFGCTSRHLMAVLAEKKIQSRPLWQPLHLSPAYAGAETLGGAVAEYLYDESLSLPCSVSLTPEDQERVIRQVIQR